VCKVWKVNQPDEMDHADRDNNSDTGYDGNLYCSQCVVYSA